MKLLVVGTAGKTGHAVVEQTLKVGHGVTALVYSDNDYNVSGVAVRVGDANDAETVELDRLSFKADEPVNHDRAEQKKGTEFWVNDDATNSHLAEAGCFSQRLKRDDPGLRPAVLFHREGHLLV